MLEFVHSLHTRRWDVIYLVSVISNRQEELSTIMSFQAHTGNVMCLETIQHAYPWVCHYFYQHVINDHNYPDSVLIQDDVHVCQ